MRQLGGIGLALVASGGIALGGSIGATTATTAGAAIAPAITHPARLAVEGRAGAKDSNQAWESSNWSGYAEAGTFTEVSGSWTVPTVTAGAATGGGGRRFGFGSTSAWYSAAWLGVDGFDNGDLIQTGTEQDYYDGVAHYSAWWEILPAAETVISEPVSAGDVIKASIVETSSETTVGGGGGGRSGRGRGTTEHLWTITLQDVTEGWTFSTQQAYDGPGSSAEWIVEAPEVGDQIASLADYAFPSSDTTSGDFNGTEVATTIGGTESGAGLSYADDAGVMVQNGAQVSTPGPQDPPATAFNALYGSTEPAAPTS